MGRRQTAALKLCVVAFYVIFNTQAASTAGERHIAHKAVRRAPPLLFLQSGRLRAIWRPDCVVGDWGSPRKAVTLSPGLRLTWRQAPMQTLCPAPHRVIVEMQRRGRGRMPRTKFIWVFVVNGSVVLPSSISHNKSQISLAKHDYPPVCNGLCFSAWGTHISLH